MSTRPVFVIEEGDINIIVMILKIPSRFVAYLRNIPYLCTRNQIKWNRQYLNWICWKKPETS